LQFRRYGQSRSPEVVEWDKQSTKRKVQSTKPKPQGYEVGIKSGCTTHVARRIGPDNPCPIEVPKAGRRHVCESPTVSGLKARMEGITPHAFLLQANACHMHYDD
jgi:hypothetical protein